MKSESVVLTLAHNGATSQSYNRYPFVMTSRRVLKAAEAIREVVGMAILTDLKDPRIENVTVTSVEVSGDMRQAKVNVSIMGDDTKQRLAMRGLESSAGYLQSKISDRIDTRYIPKLKFELDEGVKKSIALQKMLSEVLPDEDSDTGSEPGDDEIPADPKE